MFKGKVMVAGVGESKAVADGTKVRTADFSVSSMCGAAMSEGHTYVTHRWEMRI